MQETRRQILAIIHELQPVPVDEIVAAMALRYRSITPVTVRHHLNKLQQEALVYQTDKRQRSCPGRPQHLFALTSMGEALFPNNYRRLSEQLVQSLAQLPPQVSNVIIEDVAQGMVAEICFDAEDTIQTRLIKAVDYLNRCGYEARWEAVDEGIILYTDNCPYHQIASEDGLLCKVDFRTISLLLGVIPRLLSRISEGASACSYFIPLPQTSATF